MNLRNVLIIIVLILIIGSLFFIKIQTSDETYLIPSKNLVYTNIVSIEIFNRPKNEQIIIDDKYKIEKIASLLVDFNSKNIDRVDKNTLGDSIYDIYITNTGRYPDTPIIVYENAIVYKDKITSISFEKLSSIKQMLERELY